jgi:outer membrane protein OmpA-like peptidoglycan-associated protein
VTSRRVLPLALAAALAASACVSAGKLRENANVIRLDIDKAKKSGAARCAPKELALAEANVQFTEEELAYGNPGRAQEHVEAAEKNVKDALRLSKTCAPTQVVIAKPEEVKKKIVEIAKTDRDGDGVPDVDDACPDVPGPPENRGCPLVKDSDGDGIPDDIDRCPLDPEDKDGFQDEDGCPDPDNDGDGIVDKLDACPNDPGPLENQGCPVMDRDGDGVPDNEDKCPDVPGPKENQGCPDVDTDGDGIPDRLDKCPFQFGPAPDGCPKKYALVEVKREKIEIKQQVHFATNKYRVLPDSFPLLNQVAAVLVDFPKMRVSIEGHTDNVGLEKANMKLSQKRAEAVRDYLISRGIAPARLEAHGYGPTRPIASNKTAKGKAKNRRTEFRVVALE